MTTDLSTYLFVTLLKIGKSVPELTKQLLFNEFPAFFNVDAERSELERAFADLQREELIELSGSAIELTDHGAEVAHERSIQFGFDQGYAMEERSAADQTYRERLRSTHGVIGLTDETQRELAIRLLSDSAGPVLDGGCGRGEITELFRRGTGHSFHGIDSSPSILEYARRDYPDISFREHDIADIAGYPGEFASAVLVDSIYFVNDQEAVLGAFMERIRAGAGGRGDRPDPRPRRLVVFYGTFCRPEDDHSVLAAENTPVAAVARSVGCVVKVHDFAEAHAQIWRAKREELEALKEEYYRERSAYLFWERFNEIEIISGLVEQGLHGRYVFVLEPE
jgi:SAM-dependent methyltransferase